MTNITINSLPTYSGSTDHSADILPIYDTSTVSTVGVSINNLLSLSSQPVGINDSQTLTNKTLTSPTISGPTLSGTVIGTYTIGGTPTFPASVVTLTGSQTLTNKILTSPTINSATIANPTLTVDTVSGFSSSTVGTAYGLSINNGAITPTTVTASGLITASNGLTLSSGTLTLPNNSLTAAMLATSAIALGYAQITGNVSAVSNTPTQVTGLTTTVTVPAGGRKVKISVFGDYFSNGAASTQIVSIWDGTVNSGSKLAQQTFITSTAIASGPVCLFAITTPSAGSKTYNVGFQASSGTATIVATPNTPAFILVEAI